MSNSIDMRFDIVREDFSLALELSIPLQGITAVFGPSGVGKTSLLRAIAGLDRYADSYISIGQEVWQRQQHFVATHQRRLAYVFQQANLFDHLTVQANLEYGRNRAMPENNGFALAQIVTMLGLSGLLERKPASLSGGQQQRVAIARALASNPCLLMMDEPLASLDVASRQEIIPYIEALHQHLNIPIIYVSHSIEEVSRLADYLVLLAPDSVKAHGPIEQILTQLDLPLAHDNDAASIIQAQLVGHDQVYGLSHLSFAGGRLSVLQNAIEVGQTVRLRIAASDVSLTLERQVNTSILNIIVAEISQIEPHSQSHVLIRLKVDQQFLISRIT
ncbi:molybdenum ABC transporter ATP-binding protein, partial [Arenicella sp.]|nr:molybdenum ABC transporter ATP-binding protein [Arenicella sp.]